MSGVVASLLRTIDAAAAAVAAALVAATAIITCLAVFFRYVLNSALGWPQEIGGYLLVWISFVGAYLASRDQAHVRFEVLVAKLPSRARHLLRLAVDVVLVGYFLVLLQTSMRVIGTVGATNIETLSIPYGVFMAALPVGATLLVVALLIDILKRLRALGS